MSDIVLREIVARGGMLSPDDVGRYDVEIAFQGSRRSRWRVHGWVLASTREGEAWETLMHVIASRMLDETRNHFVAGHYASGWYDLEMERAG